MSKPIEQFIDDIHGRINYWRVEADLNYAEAIGALEIIKADLIREERDLIREERDLRDNDEPT